MGDSISAPSLVPLLFLSIESTNAKMRLHSGLAGVSIHALILAGEAIFGTFSDTTVGAHRE